MSFTVNRLIVCSHINTDKRSTVVFEGTQVGDIHGVGCLRTSSTMSSSTNLLSSFDAYFLMWYGIRLCGWTTGLTSSLTCNLTCWEFNLLSPTKIVPYLSIIRRMFWSVHLANDEADLGKVCFLFSIFVDSVAFVSVLSTSVSCVSISVLCLLIVLSCVLTI